MGQKYGTGRCRNKLRETAQSSFPVAFVSASALCVLDKAGHWALRPLRLDPIAVDRPDQVMTQG
ncbi:MAG: hypothetical protein JXR25_07880 [Pontiellaceae bacterium]|nr:hypothetical protein [Pontiellaceae bacterium]MBN2784730.1 hypothetical protein [Pontiellaceae bacterium]